jgi:REP element-mobilizing transposase RayT
VTSAPKLLQAAAMTYAPRIIQTDFPIHISARANNRQQFNIPLDELWQVFSDYLFLIHHGYGIQIISFVMMPNHIHMIAVDPSGKLPQAMELFMRETSREIGRRSGTINRQWGAPYHSSVIDSNLYYMHAYKYVYLNPVEANLCDRAEVYRFSTLNGLLGRNQLTIPVEEDTLLFSGPIEQTIEWINNRYDDEEKNLVRKGLKRRKFALPKTNTKRMSRLAEWASVPFNASED